MTKSEAIKLLAMITEAYPSFSKTIVDPNVRVKLYTLGLGDLDYCYVEKAFVEILKRNKFAPTVAEIRQEVELVRGQNVLKSGFRPVPKFEVKNENSYKLSSPKHE